MEDYVSKDIHNKVLDMLDQNLEMLKQSQRQVDDLIRLYPDNSDQFEKIRFKQLNRIIEDKYGIGINNSMCSIVINVVPINISSTLLDLADIRNRGIIDKMVPFGKSGCNPIHNYYGYLSLKKELNHEIAYDLLVREGYYEIFSNSIITESSGQKYLFVGEITNLIIGKINDAVLILKKLNIGSSFKCLISFFNTKDKLFYTAGNASRLIQINNIYLPAFEISSEEEIQAAIRPSLDILWQTVGFSHQTHMQ